MRIEISRAFQMVLDHSCNQIKSQIEKQPKSQEQKNFFLIASFR
jgi:hypothetical protein